MGFIEGGKDYIFQSILTQMLSKAGYSPRKTMKYLADKNLIGITTSKSGGTKNSVFKSFNNRQCRFVELHFGRILNENSSATDKTGDQASDGWRQVDESEQMELPFD